MTKLLGSAPQLVGAIDGDEEGDWEPVGDTEGLPEGSTESVGRNDTDGWKDGATLNDGTSLGLALGTSEGAIETDGIIEGVELGIDDGCEEGVKLG